MKKFNFLFLFVLVFLMFGCGVVEEEKVYYNVDLTYDNALGSAMVIGTMNSNGDYRGNVIIKATPKTGYYVEKMIDRQTDDVLSTNETYNISPLEKDYDIEIVFSKSIEETPVNPTHSVLVTYDNTQGRVDVTGSKDNEGKYRGDVTITVTPNSGYNFEKIIDKKTNLTLATTAVYTIKNINSDYAIEVVFSKINISTGENTYQGNYYNGINLYGSGNSLKMELRDLITSTHKYKTTYKELLQLYKQSDADLDNKGNIILFYSGISTSSSNFNREHVWPKSKGWFKTSGAGSDLHHIRPTDNDVNSKRGNLPYGEVSGGTEVLTSATYNKAHTGCYISGGYFEPCDRVKGDVARIIFYLLTRYSESDSKAITNVAQSMDMLLRWNDLDPVDEFERNRNEVCFEEQGNRNPFIDYSDLADQIWG